MSVEDVKRQTAEVSGVQIDDLSYITEDLLNQREASSAEAVPKSGTYTGNHFVKSGTKWTWEDQPGGQCGRTRTWTYTAQPGSTVREAGRCPQGYPWFEMYCVY